MKKWVKGMLIFAGVLMVVGIGSLVAALVVGVNSEEARAAFGKYCWFWDDDDIDWDEEGMEEYEFPVSEVQKLNFDLQRAECIIKETPVENKIIIRMNMIGKNNLQVRKEDGTLELDYKSNGRKHRNVKRIEIYLPKEMVWEDVDMDIGAGVVDAQIPLSADSMDLSVGAGEINLDSIKADALKMNADAGAISADYVDAKDSKIAAGVGSIEVGLAGTKEEYETKLNVAVGNVTFGDETYDGLVNNYENKPKDAWRKINIDCATGEIHVQFKEVI